MTSELSREDAALPPSVAFARQCLPNPQPVQAESISRWAAAALDALLPCLRTRDFPWRLHVFSADDPAQPVGARRCGLIRDTLVSLIKDRRRKLWKQLVTEDRASWSPEESLVQVALQTPETGWVSVCLPEQRERLGSTLSRFTGGRVDVDDDLAAPSGAHRKLREVQIRMGRGISAGETCVDLGGSPGGWTWVAATQGATVHVLDRSPLRDDLMSHPQVTFQKGDAFVWEPPQPVDWLLCDVIAFPPRTLELLERWLTRGWCRRFCVTIKFRGRDDDPILEVFKSLLETHTASFTLRQLDSNRNEVTAYGWRVAD